MRLSVLFGLLSLSVMPAYSQLFSVGLKAGVPLTNGLNGQGYSMPNITTSAQRWIIGPTAEIHLPFRLSFEVDALYRRENYNFTQIPASPNAAVNDWQIPILGKYELRGGLLSPFVDAGVTYRNQSSSAGSVSTNNAGFTIGSGLTAKLLFLRLSPEFRYTHWEDKAATGVLQVSAAGNQANFLVGLTF